VGGPLYSINVRRHALFMISLNQKEWCALRDAYGTAENIPALLSAVEVDPSPKSAYDEDPWFSLWSALSHQGDVYSASFAAVPHLLRIAKAAPWPFAWDLIGLPVSIEVARIRNGIQISPNLEDDYRSSLKQIPCIVFQNVESAWDHVFTQTATAALALCQGHVDLAEAIMELGPSTVKRFLEDPP
jgi:hypothetical protein